MSQPMEQSERKGLVDRLRNDEEPMRRGCFVREWAADFIESDARPAPMREAVKDALEALRGHELVNRPAIAAMLAAHIDDLTRKVAEAEGRALANHNLAVANGQRAKDAESRSRPQETDAVLAEREACARLVEADRSPDSCPFGPNRGDVRTWALTEDDPCPVCGQTGKDDGSKCKSFARNRVAAAIRSRPSSGPATETERTPEAGQAIEPQPATIAGSPAFGTAAPSPETGFYRTHRTCDDGKLPDEHPDDVVFAMIQRNGD